MFKFQLIFFKVIFLILKIGFPFGIMRWSTEDGYKKIYLDSINKKFPEIDKYESTFKKKIDINWLNNLALLTQVVIKKSEINFQHGRILYCELTDYIHKFSTNNIRILETGTARGFSALCMAKAIDDSNNKGEISTIDILPKDKRIYWNSIADLEGKKTRKELLNQWANLLTYIKFYQGNSIKVLQKINLDRVNFAFLDGSHNKSKVQYEFNWVSSRQKSNDIIVFDDYDPKNFRGICEIIDKIEKEKKYKIKKIFSDNNRGYAIAYKL